jgi:5-(carboxyamino)imidazole ribonucleotide synthase
VLDPSPQAPAAPVADVHIRASFDSADGLAELARTSDVVTFEVEHTAPDGARQVELRRPVRPSSATLAACQHRLREKRFLRDHGFPVAPWHEADSAAALDAAARSVGWPCVVKIPFAGYDGRGQVRCATPGDLAAAAAALGFDRGPLVIERHIPFVAELAVIVARGLDGERRTYSVVKTVHDDGILVEVAAPAAVPQAIAERARVLAESIAGALDLVGVLAVEMFLLERGEVLVNELAPRPHNSGHYTINACSTSQFEQHVRAICGLPLGETTLLRPAAMVNLLGDRRGPARLTGVEQALSDPQVSLHLYGKAEVWPRRKLGHVTALGDGPDDALARARRAAAALRWEPLAASARP